MKRNALGAVIAQAVQAAISLALQLLVARLLGVQDYGRFAILYGVIVLATAVVTGLVGDALVFLDRSRRGVRAGLELALLLSALALGSAAFLVSWATRFLPLADAALFGAALTAFSVEEIVRRTLGAHMRFIRVAVTDGVGFVAAIGLLAAGWSMGRGGLGTFLAAIAVGQVVACVVGWRMVPRADRHLVGLRAAHIREVWRYGAWRALQQTLRPGLFTAVRLLIAAGVGLAAVGRLEAARTYTSPLVLVVGGLSSFLFVHFANAQKAGGTASLRETDRLAGILILLTVGMGVVAVPLAVPLGPWAFGFPLDVVAVIAWLAYGITVGVVTPYGAFGAVTGRQAAVFLIRLGDTLLGLIVALAMILLHAPVSCIPFGLAFASLLGGVGLRLIASRSENMKPPSVPAFGATE